jgi:hypothetical protein
MRWQLIQVIFLKSFEQLIQTLNDLEFSIGDLVIAGLLIL